MIKPYRFTDTPGPSTEVQLKQVLRALEVISHQLQELIDRPQELTSAKGVHFELKSKEICDHIGQYTDTGGWHCPKCGKDEPAKFDTVPYSKSGYINWKQEKD